jgi:hypothetical protein
MIRTSHPGWNEGAIALSICRSLRRTRLRTTAPPSFRPVDRPNRVVSRSVRRMRATSSGWDRTVPSPWSARKSFGRESTTSRGARAPRPPVRPSAACGRAHGERPGCVGPQESSSGHESRAPWRDVASSAGRSASSGLREILSIRLGDDVLDPREARNAPGAQKRLARRRPWDYGAAREGVSNGETDLAGPDGEPPARLGADRAEASEGPRPDTPQGYLRIRARTPCEPRPGGAILRGPPGAGKRGGSLWRTSGGALQRIAAGHRARRTSPCRGSPEPAIMVHC